MALSQDFQNFEKLGSKHLHTIANKRRCCTHTPKPKLDIVLNVFGAYKPINAVQHTSSIKESKHINVHFKNYPKILNQVVQEYPICS